MSCQNLEGGYACGCPAGFLLNSDNTTCRDLDECTTGQHICQQLCINTHGSYKCGCQPGYRQIGDHCAGTILILCNKWLFLFSLYDALCRLRNLKSALQKMKMCTCRLRFYIDHDTCDKHWNFLLISDKLSLIKYLHVLEKLLFYQLIWYCNFLQLSTILKCLYRYFIKYTNYNISGNFQIKI